MMVTVARPVPDIKRKEIKTMLKEKWSYLGDGVYAKPDQWGIWLHANSHLEPTDKIYLEMAVIQNLVRKVKENYDTDLQDI